MNYIDIKDEVKEALDNNQPVVALESTIISHGMPYPENIKMAKRCNEIIRECGATPATIAIIDGRIKIGLNDDDLEFLAKSKDIKKVSRRDLAKVISSKESGATTVASTMICASKVGIKFFVTGGIGGVHRGFEETMDISADLDELAKTNVNVICAGAKSILDLPRTLEYLETKGVPVVGYQTDYLPAFFTKKSNCKLNIRLDSPKDIAQMIKTQNELGLESSVLIVNPIPEESSMDQQYIDDLIEKAIQDAFENHIIGKDLTPYLLDRIVKESNGESLKANIALVYNNALLGAKIAKEYYLNNINKC